MLQSLTYGPMPAYLAEQFATENRYTGASLGYQLAGLPGGGFTPVLVTSLLAAAAGSVTPVGGSE